MAASHDNADIETKIAWKVLVDCHFEALPAVPYLFLELAVATIFTFHGSLPPSSVCYIHPPFNGVVDERDTMSC